jgi:hypothetical protein
MLQSARTTPNGFEKLENVLSLDEPVAISTGCAKMAGFAVKENRVRGSRQTGLVPGGTLRAARDICSRTHGSAMACLMARSRTPSGRNEISP